MGEKKNNRLLFISHSSDLSGAERSLAEIVCAIVKHNIAEIGVVLPRKGKLEALLPAEVTIFYSEIFWWTKNWYPKKYSLRDKLWMFRQNLKSARKIIKEFSPDLVITNTSVIYEFAIAAKIEGVHHCWHIRETMEQMQTHFMFGDRFTNKIMSWLSDFIYVNSEYLKKECQKYFKNIFVVRQAINCNTIVKSHSISERINIAIVGFISPKKNQIEALNAYKILERQGVKNISLSVVGWGDENSEYYQKIKKLISNSNINIVQFADNMEVIYAKTDIVLVCSLETFGRVAVEAMKHSIPIIAANVGASTNNIKDGYNGYLYELGNPEDLANKIMLLQNPDVRNEMGRNGYMFAMENFNEKNMINDFMEPLSKIFGAS